MINNTTIPQNMIDQLMSVISTEEKKADISVNRYQNQKVDIKREGTQIILPADPHPMRYQEAIACLQMKEKEEETVVSVRETVNAFPFDGAYAFMKAMKQIYGWATPVPTESFFGPKPPTTINLEIDFGVFTQIIWGEFKVPGLDGTLSTGIHWDNERPMFMIGGVVKKKSQFDLARLAQLTREIVARESIYKGKAISLTTDDKGDVNYNVPPKFIDLTRVNKDELTFSEEVGAQVQTNLFTPIEYTAACRMHQIPLKRGVLLEGPFGTGKTLTAFVTALKARENGWTFILIDRVGGLEEALQFARMYQPSVVFAEDVDRAVSGSERTVEMDDILNTIDGLESKGSEVITILTSNDVKNINRAMIRPGRLDAIISVQAPDNKAVQKLISLSARGLLEADTDLTGAGEELEGQIPAVIREVVERSKLYAIGRAKGGRITLTGADLVLAAKGMKHHLNLLNGKTDVVEYTPEHRLGAAMSDIVGIGVKGNGFFSTLQSVEKTVNKMHERIS